MPTFKTLAAFVGTSMLVLPVNAFGDNASIIVEGKAYVLPVTGERLYGEEVKQVQAIVDLGKSGHEALIEKIRMEKRAEVVGAIIGVLAAMPIEQQTTIAIMKELLSKWSGNDESSKGVRVLTVRALAQIGSAREVNVFKDHLNDSSSTVQAISLREVVKHGSESDLVDLERLLTSRRKADSKDPLVQYGERVLGESTRRSSTK